MTACLFAGAVPHGRAAQPGYIIHGVSLYDPAELVNFAHAHVYNHDGTVSLERLAQGIELVYREDGYFLAEADVISDGRGNTIIVVDEGRIDSVVVEGVDELVHARIEAYAARLIGRPGITQAEFERVLMLVNDLAGVTAVTEFDYPDRQGGARLVIHAGQAEQAGSLTFDNPPRELGEATSLYFTQEFYSVFGGGDLLRFQGSASFHYSGDGKGESFSGNAYYRAPVGDDGGYWEAFGGNVIGQRDAYHNYVATELEGREAGIVVGFPFYRDIHNYAYGVLEARHSAVDSSGGGVSYRSAVNAMSAMALYGYDGDEGAPTRLGLIATAGWRDGSLPAGEDDGDDQYFHLRASYGTSRPFSMLDENLSLRFEVFAQYSPQRLPAVEEFYLGTKNQLRGYRFAEASGDSGAVGLIEINHVLPESAGVFRRLNTYAFLDAGIVENNVPGVRETGSIHLASTGVGIRAGLQNGLVINSHVGIPLVDGPFTESFDPGIYLGVTVQW